MMHSRTLSLLVGLVCIVAVLSCGCMGTGTTNQTATPTATTTPTPAATTPAPTQTPTPEVYMFDMTNNNETYSVPVGSQIRLTLPENPTTGFSWNLTVSSGLTINGDDYVANTTGPLVGAGGVHVWNMTAREAGLQTITGSYRQQFDPLPGNETRFKLTLNVGGAPAANATTPASMPANYPIYTEAANGTTVQVKQGDEFGIRLAENPTTGYSWNLSASTGLQIMSDTYIPSDTTGQMVGSGGIHAWVFKANDKGNQTVSGVYIRPWEPTSVAGSYTLDVVVS